MSNFLIFNLQNAASFFWFYLGFCWWIKPRLDQLGQYEALLPLVYFQGIRFLGMMFMVDGQIYEDFPKDLANVIGLGDYTVSILAIATAIVLRAKVKIAIPLVWLVCILGLLDLANAFNGALGVEFYKYDIGGIWYMMLLTGPPTIILTIYTFYRLIKPHAVRPSRSAPSTS